MLTINHLMAKCAAIDQYFAQKYFQSVRNLVFCSHLFTHKTRSPSHKQIINEQLIGDCHQIMLILFHTKNAEHCDEDIFL